MRKLDKKVLTALCNLEDNPDFLTIRDWLMKSAEDQDVILRKAESSVMVYRAQGAVLELREICQLAGTPRDLAGKLAMEKAGVHVIP